MTCVQLTNDAIILAVHQLHCVEVTISVLPFKIAAMSSSIHSQEETNSDKDEGRLFVIEVTCVQLTNDAIILAVHQLHCVEMTISVLPFKIAAMSSSIHSQEEMNSDKDEGRLFVVEVTCVQLTNDAISYWQCISYIVWK